MAESYSIMVSRLRECLRVNPSKEEFSKVYDEYNRFLLEYFPINVGGASFLYHANIKRNPIKRFVIKYNSPTKNILEIGIGDGTVSAALAKNGNHVVGVDVSQFSIALAKKRFGNIENLDLRHMDARRLDLPQDFFDCVIGFDLIEHLPREDAALHVSEVNRVLKKGGVYLIWTVLKCMGENEEELHLKVYSLRELYGLLEEWGFELTFYDVRFILFNKVMPIPKCLNWSVFLYEKLLHSLRLAKVCKGVDYLKWLIMPPCMIEARKVK